MCDNNNNNNDNNNNNKLFVYLQINSVSLYTIIVSKNCRLSHYQTVNLLLFTHDIAHSFKFLLRIIYVTVYTLSINSLPYLS